MADIPTIFRTSQHREKLNEVFRSVDVTTLDEIARIRKPSRAAFEACKLLCLFVNVFRDPSKKWPETAFSQWQTIQHYLVGPTGSNKLCGELLQLKKTVFRPTTLKVSQ